MSLRLARCFGLVALVALPVFADTAPRQLASWEEAVELFGKQSTDVQIAAEEVVRAAGRRRVALGALLPNVSGSALASFSLLPAPAGEETTAALFGAAPYQTLGLVAQLAVIDVRAWNGLATAIDAEKATKLSVSDARRLLLVNLAQSLLSAVAAERLAELNASGLADAQSRLNLSERAHAAGAATSLDLARLRQDVALAKSQVVTANETLRQARETLGLALGLDEAVTVAPGFQLDGLAARVPAACRAVAGLDDRPDVQAALARFEVAHRGVLDVKSQFLPSLAVRSTAQAFFLSGQAIPIWNLQAVLTVPIFDGGIRYGQLRDAKAQEKQAEARHVAAVRQARVELERARRGIEVATDSRTQAEEALTQAVLTETLTRKAWDAGIGTSLELVTAASSVRAQRLTLALKDYDLLRARVVALFALSECSP
ncbi:MAG: TolC family protein [Archangium sp.]|nr:TolC family protein [Archangium sp.]MDP3573371.1 TolC family protein [Archangium sp.]